MLVSGDAILASYRILDLPLVWPSSWASQPSYASSATLSCPGTQALQVCMARLRDFVRLSSRVSASLGPPFDGFHHSVSSQTLNEDSAPSAALAELVMTSSVPSGDL